MVAKSARTMVDAINKKTRKGLCPMGFGSVNLVLVIAFIGAAVQLVILFSSFGGSATGISSGSGKSQAETSTSTKPAETFNDIVTRSDREDISILPPYETIMTKDSKIVGDVSSVLHFAVVAFPKCGTTTMKATLSPVTSMPPKGDTCLDPAPLVDGMYREWNFTDREVVATGDNANENRIPVRGVKCPRQLEDGSVTGFYQTYFPRTKLIVGIRHPVKWFESFYNMQANNFGPVGSPFHSLEKCDETVPLEQRVGCATGGCVNVLFCTNRARFHKFLAQLGKTPLSEVERKSISHVLDDVVSTTNPVFLYDVSQLADSNVTRLAKFWNDMEDYLGLVRNTISTQRAIKPGKVYDDDRLIRMREKHKINICDQKWAPIREELMKHARECSHWIRKYFLLVGRDVHVSSRRYLESILLEWENDPCENVTKLASLESKSKQVELAANA